MKDHLSVETTESDGIRKVTVTFTPAVQVELVEEDNSHHRGY